MKLMACNSNIGLSEEIASILELPLTDATIKKFADEEMFVEINENVRGQDVYLIQSTSKPANDNLFELLICIDALKELLQNKLPLLFHILDTQDKIGSLVLEHPYQQNLLLT